MTNFLALVSSFHNKFRTLTGEGEGGKGGRVPRLFVFPSLKIRINAFLNSALMLSLGNESETCI